MKMTKMLTILVLALGLATVFALPTVAWSRTGEWVVYNTQNSGLPYNGVTGLAIGAQRNIWIGTGRFYATVGGGLAKFDGENWTVYDTSNSGLPHNDLPVLTIDSQENLWIGTDGGGLAKFDGTNWTVYNSANSGMLQNRVFGLSFDAQENLWIATFGLAKFDGTNWTVYNTSNSGLPSNYVISVVVDAQENKWVGTLGDGLAKFDGTNWTVYNTGNSGLPNNNTEALAIDAQGNLWIGTDGGGLAKFDGANWTVYNTGNSGLPNNTIWELAIDAQGNKWIATLGGGLAKFDGENWTVYNTSNSGLPDNRLYCLAIDAQGSVWIGTENGGLAVYRAGAQPTLDFNGDGIVDCADMCMMVEHWGTDEPLYDIAPTPFGDGIVDVLDLIVLAEYLFTYPGAVAYWKLDETEGIIAHDSAGGNDAYVIGGAVWQPTSGEMNGALQFDGVDDYVIMPFVLNPHDGPFSVFAWIKEGAPGQVVISQTDGLSGNGDIWLGTEPSDGRLMTALVPLALGQSVTLTLESESIITDGQWHHIGLVWDGSYRSLYVDGLEVAKDTEALDPLKSSDGGMFIGAGKTLEQGSFFSGLIDDVRIYNRAITP
ncbi:MAG: two-component regulator propeller domain-containing protein [Planctomycetota bacterium]|jgi:ligand-binding sensor domain-containing protein